MFMYVHLQRFIKEIRTLEKRIALLQERLNEETVLRVSNQEKIQSLREEDSFNRNLHKIVSGAH